jgi:hypothetical protein
MILVAIVGIVVLAVVFDLGISTLLLWLLVPLAVLLFLVAAGVI